MVEGRDPRRWRHDAIGNVVSFSLRGCDGCLCREYDHIIPFSKGGESVLNNCQILQQRVNRFKGNEEDDRDKLKSYSCKKKFTERELDVIEMAIYGDVRGQDGLIKCRCKSEFELDPNDPDMSSGDEKMPAEHNYEADVEESKCNHTKKPKTKKQKKSTRNRKRNRHRSVTIAESTENTTDQQTRPSIDSIKYPSCK